MMDVSKFVIENSFDRVYVGFGSKQQGCTS